MVPEKCPVGIEARLKRVHSGRTVEHTTLVGRLFQSFTILIPNADLLTRQTASGLWILNGWPLVVASVASMKSPAGSISILPTESEDHDQAIHRVPVNGLIVILRFYG